MITGLAGSGKSSLVNGILTVLNNYTFAQCALSGKAAARLQEVTGVSGKTIHRLLEYSGDGLEMKKIHLKRTSLFLMKFLLLAAKFS